MSGRELDVVVYLMREGDPIRVECLVYRSDDRPAGPARCYTLEDYQAFLADAAGDAVDPITLTSDEERRVREIATGEARAHEDAERADGWSP